MRATSQDSMLEIITKLSEGNPGAITVMVDLTLKAWEVVPSEPHIGARLVALLDQAGIYGSRIWMLFKDVCREELGTMIGVLLAAAHGTISQADLDQAIDGQARLDLEVVLGRVKDLYPTFKG